MNKKILVCDDEPAIRKLIEYNLTKSNYEVSAAGSGEEALELAAAQHFDLAILDIMLPGMDGLTLCLELQRHRKIPVIFLSAKDTELDKIVGLELGADDYLSKPFSIRELLARVKAVLRRFEGVNQQGSEHDRHDLVFGDVTLNPATRIVRNDGNEVNLTSLEFDLLHYLAQNCGKALHRNEIMDRVWGTDFIGDSRIIDVHISHLREKLNIPKSSDGYIETVRGIGYRMRQRHA